MAPFDRLLCKISFLEDADVRTYVTHELLSNHKRDMTFLQAAYFLNKLIVNTPLTITDSKEMTKAMDLFMDRHEELSV